MTTTASASTDRLLKHDQHGPDKAERDPSEAYGQGIDLRPASAYEAVTRQMVVSLGDDVREVKTRVNYLLFMVAGAIMLEMAMRLVGL